MKYVKTESAIYITLGQSVEIVPSSHIRFKEACTLIDNRASDEEIINTLFGDLANKAKDMLAHLGERTI